MHKDKETLMSLAKIAAGQYMGKTATPLNDSIKKIAQSEALTPAQIQYVAAEANKVVWSDLFKMDKSASYDFPLADADVIIQSLAIKQPARFVSNADDDYNAPPVNTKVAEFDPYKALGIDAEVLEKRASPEARKEVKRMLEYRYEKLAQAKDDIETLSMTCERKLHTSEMEFVKAARAMLLEDPLSERVDSFKKIAEFVQCCGGTKDHQKKLLGKLAHVLKRQGIVKEADLKAPEQYISENLPARKINGRHALYVTIQTIYDGYKENDDLAKRWELVDSQLPVLKEKIRAL